jgi:hypothetical protein
MHQDELAERPTDGLAQSHPRPPPLHPPAQGALHMLGCFFVGAEKEEEYAELAGCRIGAAVRGGVLRELPYLSARDSKFPGEPQRDGFLAVASPRLRRLPAGV